MEHLPGFPTNLFKFIKDNFHVGETVKVSEGYFNTKPLL